MEWIKRMEPLWLLLVVLGGLNWAVIALFDTNVMSEVFGSGTLLDISYVVVGFAALMMVPTLIERLEHAGLRRPHAHGTS
ncbi:MAG TPA: DUF378 domain-containing protein [Thermoleophilaceae bacterium]|nr:DUF378 domain-containing protein [Thermoleophilaceae bacterium]